MDRITLKHYEERAEKARDIVDLIDELVKTAESIKHRYSDEIQFIDQYGNIDANIESEGNLKAGRRKRGNGRLVKDIKIAVVKLITEEIQKLEAELAEL